MYNNSICLRNKEIVLQPDNLQLMKLTFDDGVRTKQLLFMLSGLEKFYWAKEWMASRSGRNSSKLGL